MVTNKKARHIERPNYFGFTREDGIYWWYADNERPAMLFETVAQNCKHNVGAFGDVRGKHGYIGFRVGDGACALRTGRGLPINSVCGPECCPFVDDISRHAAFTKGVARKPDGVIVSLIFEGELPDLRKCVVDKH